MSYAITKIVGTGRGEPPRRGRPFTKACARRQRRAQDKRQVRERLQEVHRDQAA